jgi:hypothetical protein
MSDVFQAVRLYANEHDGEGSFVVAGRVPRFLPGREANVLLWGSRVFSLKRTHNGTAVTTDQDALIYIEAFAVALMITD